MRALHVSLRICLSVLLLGVVLAGCKKKSVKMVVTAAFVSSKGVDVYGDIARYISGKTGWEVAMAPSLSYEEADNLLKSGAIQVGFVCGWPYVNKAKAGEQELLAIPVSAVRKGQWPDVHGYEAFPGKYFSYTIVKKGSPLKTWADLKGKAYALNDPASNSGYNLPRWKLVQLGAKSFNEYFSKVVVSGSHEESIRLVASGAVDASSVDSLVLDYDRSIGDPSALGVEIIEHIPEKGAGAPPMVFSTKADPSLKEPLRNAILNMHKDAEGQRILKKALLVRFDAPNDSNYDDIRGMAGDAVKAGFKDLGAGK